MKVWKTFVEYVEKVKPSVVVVIGGGAHLADPNEATLEHADEFATQKDAFQYGLRELVTALGRTSRVIFVRQLPYFKTSPSCFLRPIRLPSSACSPTVARKTLEAATTEFDRMLYEIKVEFPQLELVDSVAAMCDTKNCAQRLPSGEILYIDEYHLSTAGGRYFARSSGLSSLIEQELATKRPADAIASRVFAPAADGR